MDAQRALLDELMGAGIFNQLFLLEITGFVQFSYLFLMSLNGLADCFAGIA